MTSWKSAIGTRRHEDGEGGRPSAAIVSDSVPGAVPRRSHPGRRVSPDQHGSTGFDAARQQARGPGVKIVRRRWRPRPDPSGSTSGNRATATDPPETAPAAQPPPCRSACGGCDRGSRRQRCPAATAAGRPGRAGHTAPRWLRHSCRSGAHTRRGPSIPGGGFPSHTVASRSSNEQRRQLADGLVEPAVAPSPMAVEVGHDVASSCANW